jgi:hypothetical protein
MDTLLRTANICKLFVNGVFENGIRNTDKQRSSLFNLWEPSE